MNDFNTNLMSALFKGESVDELFRGELESAINQLLKRELTIFLDYEKHDPTGYNSGNSRNGTYNRKLNTRFGEITVDVPRDRLGEFKQRTVPSYKRSTDDLESMVIQLYRKGITTAEIADLIEKMYGAYYSKTTISNMTQAVQQQVEQFHTRQLKSRYALIFADATFISVRRDTVAKEALHILVGITPEGIKEVIDYRCYPNESSENYREMLEDIRTRGCEEVLLFVCDGLIGLKDRCLETFPKAKVQSCWVHIARRIAMLVRHKDKPEILNQLKGIYRAQDTVEAQERLHAFIQTYQTRYPKVTEMLRSNTSLLTFMSFPQEIWASIYTTNLIEGLNKQLKRDTKRKEQFPNESSLDRFACTKFTEYNDRFSQRIHKGFGLVTSDLMAMFTD